MLERPCLIAAVVLCGSLFGGGEVAAQGRARKVASPNEARIIEFQQQLLETRRRYEASRLIVAKKLPKPSADDIATDMFRVKAQLIGYSAGVASLRKEDGTVIEVPLGKLSAADREWVSKWLKRQ